MSRASGASRTSRVPASPAVPAMSPGHAGVGVMARPQPEQSFAIAAAQVATPTELLPNGFVVVEGGSVVAVGQGPHRKAPQWWTSVTS